MEKYIEKAWGEFQKDIIDFEKEDVDIDKKVETIKNLIKEITISYFDSSTIELKEEIKNKLIRKYNLLYFYQAQKNGIKKAYILDSDLEKLPQLYVVDQRPERFDIDYSLLETINIEEALTIEQAHELLKWTVNNTRDNLIHLQPQIDGDDYDNNSLMGWCGVSQFSTLYPLQKMGLKVTINNIRELQRGSHAFGTVTIPIKNGSEISYKRYLIDCTYRQFFTIPYNVVSRYLGSSLEIGFFINQNKDEIEFAKELLKNGFVEANLDNLKNYLKPFFYTSIPYEDISKVDECFSRLDIIDVIENKQDEFGCTEEEFLYWGLNLQILHDKEKLF